MKIASKNPWYLEYMLIIVGTGLMATAITSCFDAAGMVTGGFSGMSILVKAWTKGLYGNGIPLWMTNLALNIPLFLLATKIRGFAFVRKALMGDISLTIWLAILPAWKLSGDFLLVALYGGLLQGIGIGFVFLGGGTTGGTDLLAAIIQKYLRHYSIAQIMQFIDGAIVVVGMYVFGVERALYAIIAVFLVTSVSASSLSPMLITLSSAGVHLLSISFVAAVIFPAFISFIIEYPIVPQSFKAFEY